jgi:hypothetical protein
VCVCVCVCVWSHHIGICIWHIVRAWCVIRVLCVPCAGRRACGLDARAVHVAMVVRPKPPV